MRGVRALRAWHTRPATRSRVVPIEVVEFHLRYFRLPTKLDLYKLEALTREYLLELAGPLREVDAVGLELVGEGPKRSRRSR